MYNEYINIYKKLKNSQLKLNMALILFIICLRRTYLGL